MQDKKFTEQLKKRLLIEFKRQDRSGVYGFTQRSMAYNSNRIEGSTLWKATERQTASLFETGSFVPGVQKMIFSGQRMLKEMERTFQNGSTICFKHSLMKPVTEELIKGLSQISKRRSFRRHR